MIDFSTENNLEEKKKQLFIELLKKEELEQIFRILGVGGTKGSEQFQRIQLKKLLNMKIPQRGKKLPPWELLKRNVTIPELKNSSSETIVQQIKFKMNDKPSFIRYLSLLTADEKFFNENFEMFNKNIANKKDFMEGISVQPEYIDIETMFLNTFNKNEQQLKESLLNLNREMLGFKEEIIQLNKQLKNITLEEYISLEPELIQSGYSNGLTLFVFLLTGIYDTTLKLPLYYLSMERLSYYLILKNAKEKSSIVLNRIQQSNEHNLKDLKKQLKKSNQEKKQLETELTDLKNSYTNDQKKNLQKINELQTDVKNLSIENQKQKIKLTQYEQQINGYTLNLSINLENLKIVVAHMSPLLYAPIIFPDITFLNPKELYSCLQKKEIDLLILQKNGLSFIEYQKIIQALKDKNISWIEIDASEERAIIINMSAIIQEKLRKEEF